MLNEKKNVETFNVEKCGVVNIYYCPAGGAARFRSSFRLTLSRWLRS